MATQAELAQELREQKAIAAKVREEILRKLAELEAAMAAAGTVTEEVQTAFGELKTEIAGADALIEDEAPPAPEPPQEP